MMKTELWPLDLGSGTSEVTSGEGGSEEAEVKHVDL